MEDLSDNAKKAVSKCSEFLGISEFELAKEFISRNSNAKNTDETYQKRYPVEDGRNFIEYCLYRVLKCSSFSLDQLADRNFNGLTFDIMVAWEYPSASQQAFEKECVAKGKQDKKSHVNDDEDGEDSALFYSDLMPMLVEVESSVGVDAFVKLAPSIPLVADVVTANFQFQALTESTAERLPYPVYNNYVKDLHRCMKELTTQSLESLDLEEGELILHVDGLGPTQRVIRHVGGKSFSGRLTLSNYALYFENSGTTSYGKPLKFDLSSDTKQQAKPCSTGPWGVPLFDKAIMLESIDMDDPLVLEFPEITSSLRRDYWLALIKEVMTVHSFIKRFALKGQEEREALAKAVLGVVRLHATRESFKVFPLRPQSLLSFTLADELLPGGDYVLDELAHTIKLAAAVEIEKDACSCPSSSSILDTFLAQESQINDVSLPAEVPSPSLVVAPVRELSSLESTVQQSTEEIKKTQLARESSEGLRAEGITENGTILMKLLSPLKNFVPILQDLLLWKKPLNTATCLVLGALIIYMEWISFLVSGFFGAAAAFLIWVRKNHIGDKYQEIVIFKSRCEKSITEATMDGVVSAQQGISMLQSTVQTANITLLKLASLALSKTDHTNHVILTLVGLSIVFMIIPFKLVLIGVWIYIFTKNLKIMKSSSPSSNRGVRRLKDWWDGIPALSVRIEK